MTCCLDAFLLFSLMFVRRCRLWWWWWWPSGCRAGVFHFVGRSYAVFCRCWYLSHTHTYTHRFNSVAIVVVLVCSHNTCCFGTVVNCTCVEINWDQIASGWCVCVCDVRLLFDGWRTMMHDMCRNARERASSFATKRNVANCRSNIEWARSRPRVRTFALTHTHEI